MWSQSTNVTDRQTDGSTDRRTTCDPKTALCTNVHCAVKIMTSPLWRHTVTWRHREHAQSIAHRHVHIYRLSIVTISLSGLVFEIFIPKVATNIITWWCHQWRHKVRIDYPWGPYRHTIACLGEHFVTVSSNSDKNYRRRRVELSPNS